MQLNRCFGIPYFVFVGSIAIYNLIYIAEKFLFRAVKCIKLIFSKPDKTVRIHLNHKISEMHEKINIWTGIDPTTEIKS